MVVLGDKLRVGSGLLGVLIPLVSIALFASSSSAVAAPSAERRVKVAASERYKVGRVHRMTLGGGYRDLWQEEISLPVLNLETVGGGLTPTGRYGGLQTAVLSFEGADGRSYTFRGTDKDPSAVLDPIFHDTVVQNIVQDQMAAQHPGGPQAAGVITQAAGVLAASSRMVVMPDDPALGEFRAEFAGMVGTFFEYPQPASATQPGFASATEIISHKELYKRLESGNGTQVDAEAFLRARLVDIFLGDFDRHRKQWRWAKLPGEEGWQPIPEDRDQAFVRFNGLGPPLIKTYVPILQRYSRRYPRIHGLTLHGWEQDRWLLTALQWDDWEPIIDDLVARLSDSVIDDAIAALPPEYVALDGERLRKEMISRRDRLPKVARRFYRYLAKEVDVQTSDATDEVRVDAVGGKMRVVVRSAEADGTLGHVMFEREFNPGETREVRLYLRGGDDKVVVTGRAPRIKLRVIPGGGDKSLDDSKGGGTRVYDSEGEVAVTRGLGTRLRQRKYTPPASDAGFVDVDEVPPRDWRSDTIPIPDVGFQTEVGLFLGVRLAHTRYGFRKHPWASKHSVSAGYAFTANSPSLRYEGLFRVENSNVVGGLDVGYSGIELLQFYGLGNDTQKDGAPEQYRVLNEQLNLSPVVRWTTWNDRIRLTGGPQLLLSRTGTGERLINDLTPYGSGEFGKLGAYVNARLDTRRSDVPGMQGIVLPFEDTPAAGYPTSGFLIDVSGRISPPLWDVRSTYGAVSGSVASFFTAGAKARATLAARLGGQINFGDTPYFDWAQIGGGRASKGSPTNRGFRPQRFAGDASVYGNLDLRLYLATLKIIVPTDVGLQAFGDIGRVIVRDEDSLTWHLSGGGGFWIAPLARANTLSVSVAGSGEDLMVYARLGFHY